MKASSVNRMCKALKAALNLAASHDDRITNAKAWTVGLAAIPEDDDTESNLVLTDEQRRDVVAAAYAIGPEFGFYVEVHAATGARAARSPLLDVGDLHAGKEPQLMMPSSLKGKNRTHANPQADADRGQSGEAVEAGRSGTRCRRAAAAQCRTASAGARRRIAAVPRGREGRRPAGRRDDLLLAAYRDHARVAGWRSGPAGRVSSFDTSSR